MDAQIGAIIQCCYDGVRQVPNPALEHGDIGNERLGMVCDCTTQLIRLEGHVYRLTGCFHHQRKIGGL
jgi:hypothetical protein